MNNNQPWGMDLIPLCRIGLTENGRARQTFFSPQFFLKSYLAYGQNLRAVKKIVPAGLERPGGPKGLGPPNGEIAIFDKRILFLGWMPSCI